MSIFENTHTIVFELSNTCQLSWFHKACPLSLSMASPFRMKETKHLSAEIVHKTLVELGKYGYDGDVNFHQYNEPLIDPRLFDFIRATKYECPEATITILTNGLNLSEQLATELKNTGVTYLYVTRYGNREDRDAILGWVREKIAPIFGDKYCNVVPWESLDNRIRLYEQGYSDLPDRCYAPLCGIVITCTGDVGLCCFDWGRSVTFGNLQASSLVDIIQTGKMQEAFDRLQNGDRRVFDVCRRCRFAVTPFR